MVLMKLIIKIFLLGIKLKHGGTKPTGSTQELSNSEGSDTEGSSHSSSSLAKLPISQKSSETTAQKSIAKPYDPDRYCTPNRLLNLYLRSNVIYAIDWLNCN